MSSTAVSPQPQFVADRRGSHESGSLAGNRAAAADLTPGDFGDLNGAEQEAVLDLMQDQPSGKAQISI